jgi:hypothetical protein
MFREKPLKLKDEVLPDEALERLVASRKKIRFQDREALRRLSRDITEWDERVYREITATELTEEQKNFILEPPEIFGTEEAVLAIHWHPEIVPLDLVRARIERTFPNKKCELIIPTQHNEILSYNGYSGVEVDCYSSEFKRKVQLLLHFKEERLKEAHRLRAMIKHTFHYRSTQLFEFLDSLLKSSFENRLQEAARHTSADDDLVHFVRVQAGKLYEMIKRNELSTPKVMLKNKLLREYFDRLRDRFEDRLIDGAQAFLLAVKTIVKQHFNNAYFYQTHQIIEEARSHGAGIVVPHPEQFWPILLADYDIDGYEVWNPQSQAYTEFLISVVHRLNQRREHQSRPILVTMGDDCHLGEKLKPPERRDPVKAGRQIGLQSAWNHLSIRKNLILFNIDKESVIEEYKQRLE